MNRTGLWGCVVPAVVAFLSMGSAPMALAQQAGGNPVLTGQPEPPPAALRPAAPRAGGGRGAGAAAQPAGFNGPFGRDAAKPISEPPAAGVTPLPIDLFSSKN